MKVPAGVSQCRRLAVAVVIIGLVSLLSTALAGPPSRADASTSFAAESSGDAGGSPDAFSTIDDRQPSSWRVSVDRKRPRMLEVAGGPGKLRLTRVRVRNESKQPLRIRAGIRTITMRNGKPQIGARGQATASSRWHRPARHRVRIAPGGSAMVDLFTQIPPDAEAGESIAALVLRNGRSDERMLLPVRVRVDGMITSALSPERVRTDYRQPVNPVACSDLKLDYSVRNTGNAMLIGRGSVVVRTTFGVQREVKDLGEIALAPGDRLSGSGRACLEPTLIARPYVVVSQPKSNTADSGSGSARDRSGQDGPERDQPERDRSARAGEPKQQLDSDDAQPPESSPTPESSPASESSPAPESSTEDSFDVAAELPAIQLVPKAALSWIAAALLLLTVGWVLLKRRARAGLTTRSNDSV